MIEGGDWDLMGFYPWFIWDPDRQGGSWRPGSFKSHFQWNPVMRGNRYHWALYQLDLYNIPPAYFSEASLNFRSRPSWRRCTKDVSLGRGGN